MPARYEIVMRLYVALRLFLSSHPPFFGGIYRNMAHQFENVRVTDGGGGEGEIYLIKICKTGPAAIRLGRDTGQQPRDTVSLLRFIIMTVSVSL